MKKISAKSTISSILMRSIWNWFTFLFKAGFSFIGLFLSESEKESNYHNKDIKSFKKERKFIPVGFTDLLRPWYIQIDFEKRLIELKKRNWFLIGFNHQSFQVKSVRNVHVDNHLFGADISIQVYAGKAVAYSISKSKAKTIKNLLLNNDWLKPGEIDIAISAEEISLG